MLFRHVFDDQLPPPSSLFALPRHGDGLSCQPEATGRLYYTTLSAYNNNKYIDEGLFCKGNQVGRQIVIKPKLFFKYIKSN